MTVLFADVTGSTALGESLDPEELRGLMGRYFATAREVVESHGGTVEKFIGDAVMAVFGLPVAHGDDVARALDSALELRDRVRDDPALGERLPIRLGVNSGEVVASRDASAGDFLMTGDAVNVAARLQQSAEPWSIVVGARAVRAAPGQRSRSDRSMGSPPRASRSRSTRASCSGRREPRHVDRAPLVGREADMAQLELVAGRAFRERRPFLVSVIAAPGVGKSRLLEEFVDRLEANDPSVAVAIAQCLPYGQRLTYWPMRALLFDLLELSPDDPTRDDPGRDPALAGRVRGRVRRPDRRAARGDDRRRRSWSSSIAPPCSRPGVGRSASLRLDARSSSSSRISTGRATACSTSSSTSSSRRGDVAMLMVALARPELLDRRPGWGGGRRNFVSLALEPLADSEVATLVGVPAGGPGPGHRPERRRAGRRQPVLCRRDRPIGRRARPGPARRRRRGLVSGQPARHRPGDGPRPAGRPAPDEPPAPPARIGLRSDVPGRRESARWSPTSRSERMGRPTSCIDRDLIRAAGRDGYSSATSSSARWPTGP